MTDTSTDTLVPLLHLEPLALAQGAKACGLDERTLELAVAAALLPDGPDAAVPGWRHEAPCAGLPVADFYPERGTATKRLRAMCDSCAVKPLCLGSALFHGERQGWWGGTSANGRQRLRTVLRSAGLMSATGEGAYIAWREDADDPPDVTPPRPVPRKPWPHQLVAVDAVVQALRDGGRCQIAMATASGKTHVAMWAAAALDVERVLVLLPSLALLAQTADVWATERRWSRVPRFAVCSDTGELDLAATTDPGGVRAFMAGSGSRLVFATYQSYDVLVAAGERFGLVVADEAHHLAGDGDKAFAAVLDNAAPADRTLYMTATPRLFRKRGGGEQLVGMDDERFGPRVFDFPLDEAVGAGVVADYRVIVAAVERGVFEAVAAQLPAQVDPHLLAGAIAVVQTMGADELGSCLSFHSRVDRARAFAQLVGPVAEALDHLRPAGPGWAGYMRGETSVRIRRRLLTRLGDPDSWGVLANARAAGEGVDVPTLDVVAIVDPKSSPVDVMQATGRALRRPYDSKVGTVLLPVLLTGSPDPADPLTGCDRRSIDLVGGVLRALRSHDTELAGQLDRTRRDLGHKGRRPADFGQVLRRRAARGLLQGRVEFRVPGGVAGDLAGAMALHLVREATPAWEEAYGRLVEWATDHRAIPALSVKVPSEEGTFALGAWANSQRARYNRGILAPERVAALEEVPEWSWQPRDDQWWAKFELLRAFVERHGRYPRNNGHASEVIAGYRLFIFLNECRSGAVEHRGKSAWLLQFPDRVAALEALPGWAWNAKDARWDQSLERAARFAADHGRLPQSTDDGKDFVDGQDMGQWLNKQRSRLRAGDLSADRVTRLRALPGWRDNFDGDNEDRWDQTYLLLLDFLQQNDRWPRQGEWYRGAALGAWVAAQRCGAPWGSSPRSTMTPDRIDALEAVPGWVWHTGEAAWDTRYGELLDYAAEQHRPGRVLRVPQGALCGWCTTQRMAYTRGAIHPGRAALLEAVPGWVWNVWSGKLEATLAAVADWYEREGDVDPAHSHRENGIPIRTWILRWRRQEATAQIDEDLAERLDDIPGWSWDSLDVKAVPVVRDAGSGQWRRGA